MVEIHTSVNHCWKSSDTGIMKHSEKSLSHFRFMRYKSHMDEEALGQEFLRKISVFFFLSLPAHEFFILLFYSSTIDDV